MNLEATIPRGISTKAEGPAPENFSVDGSNKGSMGSTQQQSGGSYDTKSTTRSISVSQWILLERRRTRKGRQGGCQRTSVECIIQSKTLLGRTVRRKETLS